MMIEKTIKTAGGWLQVVQEFESEEEEKEYKSWWNKQLKMEYELDRKRELRQEEEE